MNNGLLNGDRMKFQNNFETEIIYKNGAKETVNHLEPPQPDPNRCVHFKLSASEGLCVNLDEIRKFRTSVKSIATVFPATSERSDLKIIK